MRLPTLFHDAMFATLFPKVGQPVLAPWRLFLFTIMQFAEGLSDRQVAHAVLFFVLSNNFGTVKFLIEIGVQMVCLVRHQGAQWPVRSRDTAIAYIDILAAGDRRSNSLIGVARNACLRSEEHTSELQSRP